MSASLALVPREHFATSRAADFLEVRALQTQTGQPARRFGAVVVKELLDNALDAAETAGVAPEVELEVTGHDGYLSITVADNGPGMPAALIERVLDFSVLVSDKAAYRGPTRGLQGNALKTLLGIPTALGSPHPVVIETCGLLHTISVNIDPAGEVRVEHHREPAADRVGTRITVTIPLGGPGAGQQLDVGRWAQGFALVNPHAAVTYRANGTETDGAGFYKPTVREGWHKRLPTDPTSPHWYDGAALARLVFAHIGQSRHGGRDLPLGEFVRSFAGLTSTTKTKAVCAALPGITRLSDFEDDPAAVEVLLAEMQAQAKVLKPAVLGQVDEEHYRVCFTDWYGVRRFWLKRATTFDRGIPWVAEIALAETERPGGLFYAVNFSPTFDDPLARLPLAAGELSTVGAASFLRSLDAYPDGTNNRAAVIHLISPAAAFLDKGKSVLAVGQ